MRTTTAPAVPGISQGRARTLCAVGGALAAALAWIVEVPLLGIHLNVRFGAGSLQTVAVGEVIGVTVAASLLGWLLLALLERRAPHARLLWTTSALAALAASLALPLTVATTGSAIAGLIMLHLTVGAVVIPSLARTARTNQNQDQPERVHVPRGLRPEGPLPVPGCLDPVDQALPRCREILPRLGLGVVDDQVERGE